MPFRYGDIADDDLILVIFKEAGGESYEAARGRAGVFGALRDRIRKNYKQNSYGRLKSVAGCVPYDEKAIAEARKKEQDATDALAKITELDVTSESLRESLEYALTLATGERTAAEDKLLKSKEAEAMYHWVQKMASDEVELSYDMPMPEGALRRFGDTYGLAVVSFLRQHVGLRDSYTLRRLSIRES